MSGSAHGHTPAAWTGVTIVFLGSCVAGAFTVMAEPIGFWAGMAIMLLGGVVGMAMRAMGLGQPKDTHAVHQPQPRAAMTPEPVGAEG